jgi:hypothetical protein
MKKTFLFSLVAIMAVSSANAGLWDRLFSAATPSEPTSLEEACNTDEITRVCPEVILGQKTLVECLTDNVKDLSEKCSAYVKKSLTAGSAEAAALAEKIKSGTAEQKAAVQEITNETVQEVKDEVIEKATMVKNTLTEKIMETAAKNAAEANAKK